MSLSRADSVIRLAGGLFAFLALAIILFGIWRGARRPAGRTVGVAGGWLRSEWFYLSASAVFFGLAWWGWRPLPWAVPLSARIWMLALGTLLYFPAMVFVVWARLALGKNYFVSTGFGAQLFKEHQLVTSGPFAIIRHPMYAGLVIAALGSLLLYFTWTTLSFACFAPMLFFRARREEAALAAEFGEQWEEYCQRVPAFFPRLIRQKQSTERGSPGK